MGLSLASFVALIAASEPVLPGWGTAMQLGVAGLALYIVYHIVAKRDPEIARINAEAIRDAASINAAAVKDVGDRIDAHSAVTNELLVEALSCKTKHDS